MALQKKCLMGFGVLVFGLLWAGVPAQLEGLTAAEALTVKHAGETRRMEYAAARLEERLARAETELRALVGDGPTWRGFQRRACHERAIWARECRQLERLHARERAELAESIARGMGETE